MKTHTGFKILMVLAVAVLTGLALYYRAGREELKPNEAAVQETIVLGMFPEIRETFGNFAVLESSEHPIFWVIVAGREFNADEIGTSFANLIVQRGWKPGSNQQALIKALDSRQFSANDYFVAELQVQQQVPILKLKLTIIPDERN